jgi:phage major head subunit gpT-like protein
MANTSEGIATRGNFSDLLYPGFRKIFNEEYAQLPTIHDKIFHVMDSSKQQELDSSVSSLGQLVQTTDDQAVSYESPIQGYDKSYVHLAYKKATKISREMYEDDQYNIMSKVPKMLASATTRTVETVTSNVFANALSSGTGGDGKYLVDTQHPRTDGGTAISNAATDAFNEAGLKAALLKMRKTVDDKGQHIQITPDTLVIPPDMEFQANVILQSAGRTGTNYNEINPAQGRLKVMTWDYLTNTQAWFVLDSGAHSLNMFWRVRPEFSQDESFDTDVAKYKVRCRLSVGWSDWRGVYGSTGTGA